MTQNLRERLRYIRDAAKSGQSGTTTVSEKKLPQAGGSGIPHGFAENGWLAAGYKTLKCSVDAALPGSFPACLPPGMAVLVPGLDGGQERFLFFDLETTGLSGGAGTIAFLAAFGRLLPAVRRTAVSTLRITQYLLLDYDGEPDFINAVLGEFENGSPLVLSYNGKTFDSQILKNRCLMNGLRPAEYSHVDLLHPSRRLWKTVLPDCSQGTIEQGILGIDRRGDTPGALAPEIWFSFLKSGELQPLLGICEHNRRDIAGLAAILLAMTRIAADPVAAADACCFDVERLALHWRRYLRLCGQTAAVADAAHHSREITGGKLFRYAVEKRCPRAVFAHSLDLLRSGKYREGRGGLSALAGAMSPNFLRAAALRSLAIDSERRLKNAAEALAFAEQGLALLESGTSQRKEFEHRAMRLRRNLGIV